MSGIFYTVRSLSPPASVEPSAAPHPKSYMEVTLMLSGLLVYFLTVK